MKLKSTTKMAYQAALAIAIAEGVAWFFQFERGYWIALTAMALTMQTWGESIKRSIERITMTIIGGIVGTGLYFILPANNTLILTLLLIFVFFTVYMLQIFYLAAVFCLTCFVVFLFAFLDEWTLSILFARIVETLLGAVIALLVGACFFPLKTNITQLFIHFWEKIDEQIVLTFENEHHTYNSSQYLAVECQKINKTAIAVRYELLFHRISQADFYLLLNETTLCTQYVINLMDAYYWLAPHLSRADKLDIEKVLHTTRHNLKLLMTSLKSGEPVNMLPVTRASDLIDRDIAKNPERFAKLDSEALGFFNLMYFFTRVNMCLNNIRTSLNQAQEG